MGLFNREKKRRYRWEPLWCSMSDLLHVMHESLAIDAPIVSFMIECSGGEHEVGISADYEKSRGFFDLEFYVDDSIYKTWDIFLLEAAIDGRKLTEITEPVAVLKETESGDPRAYKYLAEREDKSLGGR